MSKSKAFVDDKVNLTQELNFLFGRLEYIVGKGRNAIYPKVFFSLIVLRFNNIPVAWPYLKGTMNIPSKLAFKD